LVRDTDLATLGVPRFGAHGAKCRGHAATEVIAYPRLRPTYWRSAGRSSDPLHCGLLDPESLPQPTGIASRVRGRPLALPVDRYEPAAPDLSVGRTLLE
jgi:hypothetical protein